MELNEIKKALYKEKPTAELIHAKKDGVLYYVTIDSDELIDGRAKRKQIYFLVPLTELGETAFLRNMPAQLLIRYIIAEPSF